MSKKDEPSKTKVWLIVLLALLDDIAVLALIFIALWYFKVDIPVSAMIVIGLVLGTLVFIVHRALIPSLRRKKETGSEGMIGLECEVMQPLKPKGVVKVKGEYWKAKSLDSNIEVGEVVEVTGIDRLILEVKRKAP